MIQSLMEKYGTASRLQSSDHIFRQDESDRDIYFIKQGLLKAYYLRVDGRQHIKSFIKEGSVIGNIAALVDDEPCTYSLIAIEPSVIIRVPWSNIREAARSDVGVANALIEGLVAYGKRKERREYELLSLTPEERYTQLDRSIPNALKRVSQADIAGYIGVTPQALSRIRRRLGLI